MQIHFCKYIAIGSILLWIFASGCGYTLQTRQNLPFQEIELGRIQNLTHEPKLEDRLARALATTFPEYGIEISPSARYRMEADITGFELNVLSEQSLYAAEYQVRAITTVRIIDRQTNKVTTLSSSGPFVTYFRTTGGIEAVLAGKDLAVERGMRDIAQDILHRVIYQKYLPADNTQQPAKNKDKHESEKAPAGN
jgi:hypothetical protein